MFQEKQTPKIDKFQKVQEKLGFLVNSKLQNISQKSLRNLQDRINNIQKKLIDQITSNQTSSREYRLKLRSYQEQNWENQQKFRAALRDRSSQIAQLKEQITAIMQKQNEQRFQKDLWEQSNSQQKMEKIEKDLQRMKQDRKQDLQDTHLKISRQISCTQVLDRILRDKKNDVITDCQRLRNQFELEQQRGVRRQRQVMQNLKGTVSDIKGSIQTQKSQRQQNKQRLRAMLQQTTRNITNNISNQ